MLEVSTPYLLRYFLKSYLLCQKSNFQFNHLLFSFPFSSFLVNILNIEAKVEYKTLCLVP
jgi:hypothetical protein